MHRTASTNTVETGSGAATVAAHRAAVHALLAPLRNQDRVERVPLLAAQGRGLAANIKAPLDLPPFANSQMDGFAIRSADVAGSPPAGTELIVVAPVPAGAAPDALVPGTAAPIMTGAMIPPGADAVVPIERAVPDSFPDPDAAATVRLPATAAGTFVRDAGSDIRAGEPALSAGTHLGPGQLALLAALGLTEVPVHPRLRVLLVTTGDEVVEPGQPLDAGKIYDSNGPLLEASMRQAGLQVTRTGISADRPEQLVALLRLHSPDVDFIVTTGGVSQGAYEVVRQAMAGHDVDFLIRGHAARRPAGDRHLRRRACARVSREPGQLPRVLRDVPSPGSLGAVRFARAEACCAGTAGRRPDVPRTQAPGPARHALRRRDRPARGRRRLAPCPCAGTLQRLHPRARRNLCARRRRGSGSMDTVNAAETPGTDHAATAPAGTKQTVSAQAVSAQAGAEQAGTAAAVLTHLRQDGTAQMVDVSDKAETTREATATATVRTTAEVLALLGAGDLPKGDALAVARVAGIMAAKKTPELIPLCHPLPIAKVTVDFELDATAVTVFATVKTRGITGVEMEALTAVSVAALSVYDMIKAVDKHAVLTDIKVLAKSGGKSGDWTL